MSVPSRTRRRISSAALVAGALGAGSLVAIVLAVGDPAFAQKPASTGSVQKADVTTAPLAQTDPWSVGWLGKADGALGTATWANTDITTLSQLMSALQPTTLSPSARQALRRVMLSSARGPKDGADLIPERLRMLELLGESERSIDLRRKFPTTDWGKGADRLASDMDLVAGRSQSGCARVAERRADDPMWKPVRALCFAIAGDFNAAGATAEQTQNADGQVDGWLIGAIETMRQAGKTKPQGRYGSALEAAISVAAKLPVANDSFKAMTPDVAAAIVRHPGATPDQKRSALRIAVDAGRVQTPDVLAVLNIEPDAPAAGAKATPKSKADFVALALAAVTDKEMEDAARATVFAAAFKSADTATDFRITALALRDQVKALPKSDATLPNAEVFARVAIALGDVPAALEWRKLMDKAGKDADAWTKARIDLMLSFAGAPGEKPADILDRLVDAVPPAPETPTANKAATPAQRQAELRRIENTRALFLYVGSGRALNPAARTLLGSQRTAGRGVSDAALARIQSALDANADGEAALAAIGQLGPDASAVSFAGLGDILSALRGAGLDRDANAIALEALQPWKAL